MVRNCFFTLLKVIVAEDNFGSKKQRTLLGLSVLNQDTFSIFYFETQF
jgi:hypothetical protein